MRVNTNDFKQLVSMISQREISDAEKLKLITDAVDLLRDDVSVTLPLRQEPHDQFYIPANPTLPWYTDTYESLMISPETMALVKTAAGMDNSDMSIDQWAQKLVNDTAHLND